MNENEKVESPTTGGTTLYQKIKKGLSIAAQAIVTAPVKLPQALIKGAQYVALLIGLLDSLDHENKEEEQTATKQAEKEDGIDEP